MKLKTKLKIAAAHLGCEEKSKSLAYTHQFIQDSCKVDVECVNSYFELSPKELQELREIIIDVVDVVYQTQTTIN